MDNIYNSSFEESKNIIKENCVDLFFLDPPYFISGTKKNINLISGDRTDWDCQWESKEDFYKWTSEWMKLAYSQLKVGGSIYVCCPWQHSGKFQELLENVGFVILNRITWKRDKGRGSSTNWKSMHEDIWFAYKKGKDYTFNIDKIMVEKEVIAPYRDSEGNPKDWFEKDGKKIRYTYPGNIWINYSVPFWSMKEVRSYAKTKKSPNNVLEKHNTQKPKELVKTCIIASSNENDLVVDYFSGSGTTAIACKELNRNFIVFDINRLCIDMLKTRLKNEI